MQTGISAVSSGIRDNYRRGTVADFLTDRIQPGAKLSVVSAYFTIYAFQALKDDLATIDSLRFLFGEPRFLKALDPDRTEKKAFVIEEDGLQLRQQLSQKQAAKECSDWIEAKAQVRSVKRPGFLHGKMYHIDNSGIEDAILGSSNFTIHGLGLSETGNNVELNLEVDSNRDRKDLRAWFDELWDDTDLVEDVKDEVLRYLAQLYANHSPEFVYFKTLFHLFQDYLREQETGGLLDERIQLYDTDIWKALFAFQKDGAKGVINKILSHNGCILADSVGLGKTYTALAVIKYFELRNDRVLVLCPKKLRENWTVYQAQNNSALNPFLRDRFGYTVLSHTDLSRDGGRSGDIDLSTINWGNYDLVVIDESHNFRNNTPDKRDEEGNLIRKSRYQRLMDDIIKSGVKTRVLMLSATPVNNTLSDLRNQLYFITEDKDEAFKDSLDISSLKETLRVAQLVFNNWARSSRARGTAGLLESLGSAFFKLLDELTIARSRKHIRDYYSDTVAQLGGFPERLPPLAIFPDIDLRGEFLSYDQLNDEIEAYQLALFNPSRYILPEYRDRYASRAVPAFTQTDRENYLIGMMKVNFLKRLESSVRSFAITLRRTVDKMIDLQRRIQRFRQFRADNPDLDFDDLLVAAGDDEELQEAFTVGQKVTFQLAHLDIDKWYEALERDRMRLAELARQAEMVTVERDAKLQRLKELIVDKVTHPTVDKEGHSNRKVLVFTAFADTAEYLYAALRGWVKKELDINIAMVSGGNTENHTTLGRNEYNHILTNFSPRSKHRAKIASMPQDGEIDLLIATDCISEGQNLQDCDWVVNYDVHWNPVRIIQRYGRIDRIGSINPAVRLVNFWPTQDLEKYLTLKTRVEMRMALVDVAATLEDNPLQAVEMEEIIREELKYREAQLKRLQDEVLDLEDVSEVVDLTDFTLDDFRAELANYIEANKERLKEAPTGLYSVVPTDPNYPGMRPGVIFCLRQKGQEATNTTINPLQPHFLVYIQDDGAVRYNFAHPKQILQIYRQLCASQTAPYEELCALFDDQTQDGFDMSTYDQLLSQAVTSIASTFRRRAIRQLQNGRNAILPGKASQATETTDFDLITWLVIKECPAPQ